MLVALLIGFALGFLGSVPIAGPISAMVFERALQDRPREGRAIALGAAVAESFYALMAFWGLATVFHRYPRVLPASRLAGAVIFIVLGAYFILRRTHAAAKKKREEASSTWLLGFTITAVNPTLLVTWTGALTALHSTGVLRDTPADAPLFAAGVGMGIALWFMALVWLVHRFRSRFRPESLDWVLRVMGGLFVIAGLVIGARMLLGGG